MRGLRTSLSLSIVLQQSAQTPQSLVFHLIASGER